ncbi:hypothetical protein BV25DRAFT_1830033 [Artomyces pyxidatus]|uniref:Uncharacterized protein n=1 Tax=Artomyces pyxidatus TaxID=48021 RepID=A0ACB8SQ01_9AGAM|nr:hypothetical protein BV25DRAFT_1830033 [Artomyces pyxidatus]
MSAPKVSFTVRRPTPDSRATSTGADSDDPRFKLPALPRHLTTEGSAPGSPLGGRSATGSPKPRARTFIQRDEADSSDEEKDEDELVTGFDQFGVERAKPKEKPQGPLVIPALQNRDWRELARKRRGGGKMYVPPGGHAGTGKDGSVGGLGTKDTINSGPQMEGLQVRKRVKVETHVEEDAEMVKVEEKAEEETEEQRAIRALLAGDDGNSGPVIDIIPTTNADTFGRRGPTEDDAFKQDVEELPDEATLDDYERVPVSQFGAALLRGMGWKEGQAASTRRKGMVEPWLPAARPALLGIGAKEKEVFDDGSGKRRPGGGRPDKKYIPVIKKEANGSREGSQPASASASRGGSRRSSRSPGRGDRERRDGDRDRERRRDGDRDRDKDRRRDDRDRDRRDSGRGSERERDRRRDRSPRSRHRDY